MDVVKPKPSENSLNAFPTLGGQLFSFTPAPLRASPFPGRVSAASGLPGSFQNWSSGARLFLKRRPRISEGTVMGQVRENCSLVVFASGNSPGPFQSHERKRKLPWLSSWLRSRGFPYLAHSALTNTTSAPTSQFTDRHPFITSGCHKSPHSLLLVNKNAAFGSEKQADVVTGLECSQITPPENSNSKNNWVVFLGGF